MKKRWWLLLIPTIFLAGIISLIVASVYLIPNPRVNPLSRWLPWPLICSTRGCVTTMDWAQYIDLSDRFSEQAGTAKLSSTEMLTTLARQHLVSRAQLKSSVTEEDAWRYRTEILNLSDEEVKEFSGLEADEYDKYVVLPLLRQENIRQYRQAETTDELYKVLAGERWMAALPIGMWWDKTDGSIRLR